jgi:hypothetical protein
MKKFLGLLTIIALLCACVLLTGFDFRDEARIAALESRVKTLEANQATNTVAIKIWTLNHLEALEIREAERRFELHTNIWSEIQTNFSQHDALTRLEALFVKAELQKDLSELTLRISHLEK